MIHLLQHANTSEDPSIFQADISKIPSLTFNDTNDFAIFRFNIYYKQGIPLSKCTFHGTQPETKDGAIIVSI